METPNKVTNNKSKRQQWDVSEDVSLSRAWAATTEDPILGNDQTRSKFWETVKRLFDEYQLKETRVIKDRTISKLKNRFNTLQKSINDYISCVTTARGNRESGSNESDVLDVASTLYKAKRENENKKKQQLFQEGKRKNSGVVQVEFKFFKAYEVLHTMPKFTIGKHLNAENDVYLYSNSSEGDITPTSTSNNVVSLVLSDDENAERTLQTATPSSGGKRTSSFVEKQVRPMGNKRAKKLIAERKCNMKKEKLLGSFVTNMEKVSNSCVQVMDVVKDMNKAIQSENAKDRAENARYRAEKATEKAKDRKVAFFNANKDLLTPEMRKSMLNEILSILK